MYLPFFFHFGSSENIRWTSSLKSICVMPFTAPTGPRVTIPSVVKEIFLFFTSTLMEHIVDQSNMYASECLGERYSSWQPITLEELKAYFGFMILMGLVKLPSIYDYWKKDEVFHYAPVASRILRDRFFELHRFLHFEDNSTLSAPGTPGYDRLGKVGTIITMLSDQFAAVYNPTRDISIDEAMVPFKGRSSLKYLPKKPVRRGIKVWMRADSLTGYVSAFQVYVGKKDDTVERNLGANVIKCLTEELNNTYRHVYFDNYFSGVDLLDLFRAGLYACGTLRLNQKGFPSELKTPAKKGLKERGDSKTVQKGNLTLTVWQDNKPVTVIATNSDPTATDTVTRKKKDGTRQSYPCPTSVALYNKNMGGVDHNDQLRGYYHVRLKCRKYYKYIFWFLFDLAITNSYILCRLHTDLHIDSTKNFRVTLGKELIGGYCSRKRPGRPSAAPAPKRFCQAHFPVRGADKVHRCHYCHKYRKERRSTVWYCKDCDLFLCHTGKSESDCFLAFHSRYGPTCSN